MSVLVAACAADPAMSCHHGPQIIEMCESLMVVYTVDVDHSVKYVPNHGTLS
jgi:hypothetical protein